MGHDYGRIPGNVNAPAPHGMLEIPGAVTLTQVAAGAVDLNDMGASDSLNTLTVGGTDILNGAVTFTTDLATTARLVAININNYSQTSGFWARIKPGATDWVQIFRNDGATGAATVSGTDTGFTPAYVDVNTEIAAGTEFRAPSWNYGIDMFATTNVYKVGFDLSLMPGNIPDGKGVFWTLYPEDQVVYGHIGPEGVIYCPSAVSTVIPVKGVYDGDVTMFVSAAGATNCAHRLLIY